MALTASQRQHVDFYRKVLLRKALMTRVVEGALYIPFCGDGDIAAELYIGHDLYAADIDEARTNTFRRSFPEAHVANADCDKSFPFAGIDITWALADFDAYAYPYEAFRRFWATAKLADPFVIFFTDGERQGIKRSGYLHFPDGHKEKYESLTDKRILYNYYAVRVVWPWLEVAIQPWHVLRSAKYLRRDMLYWGAIISRTEAPKTWAEPPKQGGEHKKKFDAAKKNAYLDHLRSGMPRATAAAKCGVSQETVTRHIEQYGSFAEAVSQAEMQADDEIEAALYEAAKSGNIPAIQTWLFNRRSDRWRDVKSLHLSGADGGPIEVKVTEVINLYTQHIVELFYRVNELPDPAERKRLFAEGADDIVKKKLLKEA